MSAWTPGPWDVNPICNGDYLDIVSERGEGTDRVLFSIDADRPNAKANAALVAAAPRMAEELAKADALLRRIEEYFLESNRRPRPDWFGDVQTTIAGTSAALKRAGAL